MYYYQPVQIFCSKNISSEKHQRKFNIQWERAAENRYIHTKV